MIRQLVGRFCRPQSASLPKAIILGAQKSGTSALAAYLGQHPAFLAAREKEVDFFGSAPRFAQGLAWYAQQWPSGSRAAIRFETSPHYLRAPEAAARIRNCLPDTRLIVVVRNPVDRAFSAWNMYRRQLAGDPNFYRSWNRRCYSELEAAALVPRTTAEVDDFCVAVEREADYLAVGRHMEWSILEYGLYGPQITSYLNRFPREQLLIVDSQDLRHRREATLNRVLRFLDLPTCDWSSADLSDVFVGPWIGPIPTRSSRFLIDFYSESNSALASMMRPLPQWVHHSPETRRAA